jgi:hypothetical protein
MGFVKLQADRRLGRAYAGLLPFVEGLYHMGYISKEVYEAHIKRYSEPLETRDFKAEQVDPKTKEITEKLEQTIQNFKSQWDYAPFKSKVYIIQKALKYQEQIPKAKQFLEWLKNEKFHIEPKDIETIKGISTHPDLFNDPMVKLYKEKWLLEILLCSDQIPEAKAFFDRETLEQKVNANE